ncbi:hypothetical protein [Cupriavidus sp. IK-TO18]|uniref:hypothetical protein n=1 Tax=Cupriavidus sp. IK-TO18 TaxID=2782182 RepID=UPI001898CF0C|nr:hypothetical protein [Cupriavidus sp. IK-TO18]MBF6987237.1 hypothetical protein [Cupriavidus sp. IK-TO18]
MPDIAEKFWIVWSPTGMAPPKYRHSGYGSAVTEAERLAREHPGQEFIVLGAETARKVDNMTRTDFAVGMPF